MIHTKTINVSHSRCNSCPLGNRKPRYFGLMNLIDRLAHYSNTTTDHNSLLKKFSSQEILPTQRCYDRAVVKTETTNFERKPFDDDKKLTNDDPLRYLDLYKGPELPASAPETSRTTIGKVRQLFEERRKQTRRPIPTALTSRAAIGRDKSYPLQPIRRSKENPREDENEPKITQPIIYDNSIFGKLPNLGGRLLSEKKPNLDNKEQFSKSEEMSNQQKSASVSKLTEGMSRLSTRTSNGIPKRQIPQPSTQKTAPPVTRPRPVAEKKPATQPTIRKPLNEIAKPKPKPKPKPKASAPPPPGMASCRICGRNFTLERISLHQEICEKASRKKRKTFDPVKQRLKGTEAEGMIQHIKTTRVTTPSKKNNWRKQHEEFIANIRAARTVQNHLARGGKLSDLPPPPPIDTSDYVQCPHCNRKFNEAAAERHIPKCVNIRHNKPKNVPAKQPPSKLTTRSKVNTTRKR